MHIVVAGGRGFIGKHFVAHALEAGHKVSVFSRTGPVTARSSRNLEVVTGGLQALAASRAHLASADIICHLASTSIPSTSNASPVEDVESNLLDGIRLLEAMRQTGNKRILFISTGGAIYGQSEIQPIPEDCSTNPISSYGIVKLAFEKYLGMYAALYGFRPIIFRPSNPYGPGQASVGTLGVVNTFLQMILRGEKATLFGDGTVVRDFVYIDDVCKLLLRALESDATGIFNCGSGIGTSLNELIDILENACHRKLARDHHPAREFDPKAIVLDISKARETFGWRPEVSLQTGIRHVLNAESEAVLRVGDF